MMQLVIFFDFHICSLFRFHVAILNSYFLLRHGDGFSNVDRYKLSTLSLAHGVLRKNFSDDLIDGLLLKQLILFLCAIPSQP
jgi:hypothetical protein